MNKQDITILGISPGTQYYGIAILRNGRLKDRRVKNFMEGWSQHKLNAIENAITDLIIKYDVTAIALKSIPASKNTEGNTRVIHAIKELADQHTIKLYFYALEELQRYYSMEKKVTKEILKSGVLEDYPEMIFEHTRELQRGNPYYIKVFEAIAAATLCSHEMK